MHLFKSCMHSQMTSTFYLLNLIITILLGPMTLRMLIAVWQEWSSLTRAWNSAMAPPSLGSSMESKLPPNLGRCIYIVFRPAEWSPSCSDVVVLYVHWTDQPSPVYKLCTSNGIRGPHATWKCKVSWEFLLAHNYYQCNEKTCTCKCICNVQHDSHYLIHLYVHVHVLLLAHSHTLLTHSLTHRDMLVDAHSRKKMMYVLHALCIHVSMYSICALSKYKMLPL